MFTLKSFSLIVLLEAVSESFLETGFPKKQTNI